MKLKAYYGSRLENGISLKKVYSKVVDNLEVNIEFVLGEKVPYCFIVDKTTKECMWEDYVSKSEFNNILEAPMSFLARENFIFEE
ncbi:MAG: hypothetical protein ACRC0G_06080 [Fusobacteriaceae bacterium]